MHISLPAFLSYYQWLRRMVRRPVTAILIISAITLLFASQLPWLSFSTSIYDFVIEDLPETARYQAFRKIFGSDEIIRLVVRGENVFDPLTFRKLEQLSQQASKIRGIRRVISLPEIKNAVDIGGKWDMERFASVLAPADLFRRNIISENGKTTALTLILENEADKHAVIRAVREMIAESSGNNLSLYQIGMPLVSEALADFTQKDFFRLPPITFLLIALILFCLFRNLTCLLLPMICVALSLIWTFGLMALTGVPLSMLTMVVPIFLIAVGTAYCLYICSEYLRCTQHAGSPQEAAILTFSEIALPTFLAVLTTLIGLGSLLVNRITAIHEFAIFSCFGVFSLLIIVLTLFPCALSLIPLPSEFPFFLAGRFRFLDKISFFINYLLDKIIRLNLNHQKTTLALIGLIALFCGIGIFRLRAETNPVDYFKKETQVSRNFHDIYQDLSGSFPINILLDGQTEDYYYDTPEHIQELARVQQFLETLPGVDKTLSFANYLKLVNYALNRFDPQYYTLPEESFEVRMLFNNYKTLLGEDMLSRFMSPDFSKANILLLTHISSSQDFLHTREKILAHAREHLSKSLVCEVTGLGIAISASSQILVSGQVKSLSLTLILIFGIMFLLFLSFRVGFIALLPTGFPIIVSFGLMGWLGIRLSVATSLIASIAIGLAVDDIIHYLVRYSREFKKDLDKDRALRDTIRSVGQPIIFTSLTISIGFSILIFSHFKPTAVFGFLMVITMFSALVGDLLLLPALMLHVELVTAWDILRLMPTLGGVSAGIAHELNQPLTVIRMGSDVLKMMARQEGEIPKEQIAQVVSEVGKQVDRASEMINRLMNLEERPGFAKERISVNRPIQDTLAIVSHELKLENIKLKLDLDKSLPLILAHNHRMAQVVFNLISNAKDAIREKKTGTFRVITIRSFLENDQVIVIVSDTGMGMAPQLLDRIFEPFFTTKESGKGKGLGLSISNEIVRDYGGHIDIQSDEGKGTRVELSFPSHKKEILSIKP